MERFEAARVDSEQEKISVFNRLVIEEGSIDLERSELRIPSATWTYLINDNPFENEIGVQLMGNMGLSIGGGIHGPLLALYMLWKKWIKPESTTKRRTGVSRR